MNQKFNDERKLKIDNLKNITLSDIINKKKKFKGFREPKDIQLLNNKLKYNNNKLSNIQYGNIPSNRIITNQVSKNQKLSKLSLDLFPDVPYKLNENVNKKRRKKYNHNSNKKYYPKNYLMMIRELSENNYQVKEKKRLNSCGKSKKAQANLMKKLIEEKRYPVYDGNIPLMAVEKSRRKKRFMGSNISKEITEKSFKDTSLITKKDSIQLNPKLNQFNNIHKPQCLYKGPMKFDSKIGEDSSSQKNSNSLFRTFMSRNLKPAKNEYNIIDVTKDSQACTFIRYDVNGTMMAKRVFNSTFRWDDNESNIGKRNKKEIMTTINVNDKGGNKNKKKRSFGGIMLGNKAQLF